MEIRRHYMEIIGKYIEITRKIANGFQDFFRKSKLITPTLLQMEASECGAAALGIIAGYYRKYIPLEELRINCGVSRDGSRAINMLKAARNYGFEAYGAESDIDGLKALPAPYIVFWKFDHYVVVEDIQEKVVFINDPATGRRSVTLDEFNKSYTGVLLVVSPGQNFKPSGIKPSLFRSFKERITSSIDAIKFLILLSLILFVPGIILPGFSKIFVDDILISGYKNWLVPLLLCFSITALFSGILSAVEHYYILRLNMKLMIGNAAKLLWRIFRLPIAFFEQRYSGDIIERFSANDRIAGILSNGVSASVVSFITMFFFAIIMFFYDYVLSLFGIITALINAGLLYFISDRLRDTSRKFLQDNARLEGIEIDGIRNIETLKSNSLDDVFFRRWSGNHAKIINSEQKLGLYSLFFTSLPGLLSGLTSVLILGIGGYRVMQGYITIGTLVAFQILLASFSAPLNVLLGLGLAIQEIPGDIARIDDVLNQVEDKRFQKENKISALPEYAENAPAMVIEMKDVEFGYSPLDPPFIQNFNLSLKKGGSVGIVGSTGSGKSTIAKLATGLHKPWSGEIKLYNQNLDQLAPPLIAELLALVDQDILLFEGTVRDNLTLWEKDISDEHLVRTTQTACIYDVIKTRPRLFHAHVNENGSNFSNGERQRLEIARAITKEPKILILDEGTAAMDAITEQEIMHNLKNKGYSLLLITHRLGSIRHCDEILVMEQGKIIERGNHEQLMKKSGHYSKLIAVTEEKK